MNRHEQEWVELIGKLAASFVAQGQPVDVAIANAIAEDRAVFERLRDPKHFKAMVSATCEQLYAEIRGGR